MFALVTEFQGPDYMTTVVMCAHVFAGQQGC